MAKGQKKKVLTSEKSAEKEVIEDKVRKTRAITKKETSPKNVKINANKDKGKAETKTLPVPRLS